MYDIITIGGAVRDANFLFTQKKERKQIGKFTCFLSGVKINVDHVFFTSGGGACNVAVGLAGFGLKTAAIACVGNDASGREVIADLKKHKVETKFISIDPKYHTAISSVINPADADRTILTYRGANENLSIDRYQKELINSKLIYVAALDGHWQRTLTKIFNLKSKNPNLKIAWNPGMIQLKAGKNKLAGFLKKTDILILNKVESSILTGQGDKNIVLLLKALYKLGPKIVAITCAGDGAFAMNNRDIIYAKSQSKKIVDTTGAGDSFSSGFLAAYLLYQDIDRAVKLGILNSAANLKVVGAQDGLLSKKDLKKLKI